MLPDRVSNPRPPTYESGALPIVLRGLAVISKPGLTFNQLYTGGLFHCYVLDKSICPFTGVRSVFCHFYSILDGESC